MTRYDLKQRYAAMARVTAPPLKRQRLITPKTLKRDAKREVFDVRQDRDLWFRIARNGRYLRINDEWGGYYPTYRKAERVLVKLMEPKP